MIWFIVVMGYILCGFLAYGIMKGQWRDFNIRYDLSAYDKGDEFYCLCVGLFGPIGLAISFIGSRLNGYNGFCLKMPPELRKKP